MACAHFHELELETGVAASARVANLIGARLPSAAKRASHASALLSVVVGAIVMIVLIATKDVSVDPQILKCRAEFVWRLLDFWVHLQR